MLLQPLERIKKVHKLPIKNNKVREYSSVFHLPEDPSLDVQVEVTLHNKTIWFSIKRHLWDSLSFTERFGCVRNTLITNYEL